MDHDKTIKPDHLAEEPTRLPDERIAEIGMQFNIHAFINDQYRRRSGSEMTVPEQAEYDRQIAFARALLSIAEDASLRVDAERLDWMEQRLTGASDSERYLPFRIYWGKGTHKGIREVIDAARGALEGKKDLSHVAVQLGEVSPDLNAGLVVPYVPTDEMVDAAMEIDDMRRIDSRPLARMVYRAMISAAPLPSPPSAQGKE